MKSEFFPGIEFEYTLDGVLFEKYDQQLLGKYFINLDYLDNHLEELIQLRDVVIPHCMNPLIGRVVGKRTVEDWEGKQKGNLIEHGIYMWMELFSREVSRTIDERCEDDIRLALDIVKKYPEHKELISTEKWGIK